MTRKKYDLQYLILAALLCAIGIIIPMFCPKIIIGPASFTLASHVPIFIAMFISLPVAVMVTLGTTLGFFLAGFPLVITLRALSHIVFVLIGAYVLKRKPELLSTPAKTVIFGLWIALIHAAMEALVVTVFYFGGQMSKATYTSGYFISVMCLIFFGGIVQSMVDFGIALAVWRPVEVIVKIPVSVRLRRVAVPSGPDAMRP